MTDKVCVVNNEGIDSSRLKGEDFPAVSKILIEQSSDNGVHITILHSDFHTDSGDLMVIQMTVCMGVQLLVNYNLVHIGSGKFKSRRFSRISMTDYFVLENKACGL